MTALSQDLLLAWKKSVQTWAAEGSINRAARDALALQGEQPLLDQLISQWSKSDFSGLPPIELLDEEAMPGAAGAYAVSTGTIYLNRGWLSGASNEQVHAVLTEELGHHIDAQLNESDTPGDEGELFSKLLLNPDLSAEKIRALKAQDDTSLIHVAGNTLEVETAIDLTPPRPGSENPETLTGTTGDDLIDGFGGNDTISGLDGDDILIGGEGNDSIDGGLGSNRIFGDAGDDAITSRGSDTVDSGKGNNQITITGTATGGSYISDSGNDSYTVENGATDISINAGDGINTINAQGNITRFDSGSSNDIVNLNSARDFVITGDGDDTITATGLIGREGYYGSKYYGIRAGNGNDLITLNGGSGRYRSDDETYRRRWSTLISGEDGDDTITLRGGKNYGGVKGGTGDDLIDASEAAFATYLHGDDGDDTIQERYQTITSVADLVLIKSMLEMVIIQSVVVMVTTLLPPAMASIISVATTATTALMLELEMTLSKGALVMTPL